MIDQHTTHAKKNSIKHVVDYLAVLFTSYMRSWGLYLFHYLSTCPFYIKTIPVDLAASVQQNYYVTLPLLGM